MNEKQKPMIIAIESQLPGHCFDFVCDITYGYAEAQNRRPGIVDFNGSEMVEQAQRFTQQESSDICYTLFHKKHRAACPVELQMYPCLNIQWDKFFQGSMELMMVQTILEHCYKFVDIEGQLYGVLYRFPHDGELVAISSVARYWGACPEDTVETIRIPDHTQQWVTLKLPITRMAIVDAYFGHVQHYLDIMQHAIPTIAIHQE